MLSAVCGAVLIFTASILYLSPNLPSVEKLRDVQLQIPLRVYTKDQQLIAEFGEKRRKPITFEQIPPLYTKAILAAEDDSFFDHHGVSISGLARAALEIISTGSIRTGGSTITMQVAKNYFLTRERTFTRKFNEILLALQIERELTKNEIMELYVNKIYLGHRSYGIAAAANVYYGKEIAELNLPELAMIAGLPKAPSKYNPLASPTRALERRNWILSRMEQLKYISKEDYLSAVKAPITAAHHGLNPEVSASYLAEMVRKEMLDKFGINAYTDGYTVVTTVSAPVQAAANNAVYYGLQEYDQRHGYRGREGLIPDIDANASLDTWLAGLKGFYKIGPLYPAVITSVDETFATALLKDGTAIELQLDDMKWARRYNTVNIRGPQVKKIEDVLAIGDIVRVRENGAKKDENGQPQKLWSLSQLPKVQGALVSLAPEDGALQAIVGGFDFIQSKFNRAVQAGRQAGSSIKPFIYSAALEEGFTAATIINDAPVVFDDKSLESTWRPENSGGKFHGPTRLRQALYKSRNLVSIRLLRKLGVSNAVDYLSQFGFDEEKLPKDLSLALGSAALTPLEVATGFAAFANGGFKVEPYFIEQIINADGVVIFEADPSLACESCEEEALQAELDDEPLLSEAELEEQLMAASLLEAESLGEDTNEEDEQKLAPRIIDKRNHFIINNMLQDVIKKGTGRRALALGRRDIAGKTGTTNDQKDAWFSGYNRDFATIAWVGFDEPATLGAREYGGTAALPIWIEFMKKTLRGSPTKQFKQPDGLVTVRIDPETGERAKPGQTNAIFEIFREEQVPTIAEVGNSPEGTSGEDDSIEQLF